MKHKGLTKSYLLMLFPGYLWLILFSVVPMVGFVFAFQDFTPGRGFFGSDWVGFDNFAYLFSLDDSKSIFFNTLYISIFKIAGFVIVPLIFSLLLNELRVGLMKKWIQTVVYLPHFLSWVILAGIMLDIFALRGPVNHIIEGLGGQPVAFFAKAELFPTLAIASDVWKEFGFNAVLYLAALTAISPSLYESAAIDGASRWQQLWRITLPSLSTTVVLLTVLGLGNILNAGNNPNAGFDQIFNLYNPLTYSTGDIIDTWVYRSGLLNLQFGLATAAGLLKSTVGFLMISLSYFLAQRYANYRIF
jgi:putative aldouronate transport system permease protein